MPDSVAKSDIILEEEESFIVEKTHERDRDTDATINIPLDPEILSVTDKQKSKWDNILPNGIIIGTKPAGLKGLPSSNGAVTPISKWKAFGGVFFALLAAFFFSLVHCFVKLLPDHHAFSLSFWRQVGNVVPSIPLVLYYRYYKKEPIFDDVWPLTSRNQANRKIVVGLAVRAFLGSSCVILRFYALDFLSVADTTSLMYGGPIFIIALSHVFLHEPCGIIPVLTSLWALFGVCIIMRPPLLTGTSFDAHILLGTTIILIVVLFQGIVTILIRKVRKVHFAVMTLLFGAWGMMQSGIVALSFNVLSVPTRPQDILFTTLLSLSAFSGQICAILSLKMEEAGVVSLCRTSDVIFAFILQGLLLQAEADIFSFLGASIILSGVVVTAARKWLGGLPDKSPTRQRFAFILK